MAKVPENSVATVKNARQQQLSQKELAECNYNLDCKNPHETEVNHRDPEELMVEHQEIVHQLEAAQQALKAELTACLGGEA